MSHTTISPRVLHTAPAADYIGKTESTLEKWRVTGGGPPFIKSGRTIVYDIRDLDDWLDERRFRSTSEVDAAWQANPQLRPPKCVKRAKRQAEACE